MDHERWSQIESIFYRALEVPAADRAAFLDRLCAASPELRPEIESLLESLERAGGVIEEAAGDLTLPARATRWQPGQRVGAYELVRELATGGMGHVWLAERADAEFRKVAAVKFLAPGLSGVAALGTFRRERQILAALDHPNIVRLLDGGTTSDGMPYLVMDYVEGIPIDRYCHERSLTVTDRLRLFLKVCDAVHYAHQNLVVHRDLKPTNILVTSGGVPKLLDFGIAKLLGPEPSAALTGLTSTGLRVFTPEYASPEQIRGEPVTTATDVYALGVILFKLLTGRLPYRLRTTSPAELERAVAEQEPERPSAAVAGDTPDLPPASASEWRGAESSPDRLRRRLRGDLDAILLMALRKEPQRRYRSVAEFASDIRGHLDGVPVLAREHALAYRAGRFVRRHKRTSAAALLVVSSLITGSVIAIRQAQIAERERERAERRFKDVRRLASSFLFEFDAAIQNLAGATPARRLVVAKALEYLDGLAAEAGSDSGLLRELADAYTRIGDIQGSPAIANLGDAQGALESYRKALAISRDLLARDPAAIEVGRDTARLGVRIGDILLRKIGDPAQALATYEEGLRIAQQLGTAHPHHRLVRRDLAISFSRTGNALLAQGDADAARARYQASLELFQALHASAPDDPQATSDLAFGFQKLADVDARSGDLDHAIAHFERSLELFQAASRADPANGQLKREVTNAQKMLADALHEAGRASQAVRLYTESLAGIEALLEADPRNDQGRRDLANVAHVLARALAGAGKVDRARRLTARSLAITRERAERPGASPSDLAEYAWVLLHAEPRDLRNPRLALSLMQRASSMANDRNPEYLGTLALAHYALGDTAQGDEVFARALALLPPSPSGASLRRELEARRSRFRGGAS
jgi:serine/threonine protein kinase/tetratricopeptide (TPR) repeat protein